MVDGGKFFKMIHISKSQVKLHFMSCSNEIHNNTSYIYIHSTSPQYELLSSNEFISLSYEDRQLVSRPTTQYLLTGFASFYMIVDVAWMFAVWSAASVGKLFDGKSF